MPPAAALDYNSELLPPLAAKSSPEIVYERYSRPAGQAKKDPGHELVVARGRFDEIHQEAEGAAAGIPVLTLSVSAGRGGRPFTMALKNLTVGSIAENLSGSLSGTATLAVRPR
jgi:hypothetical protein